jgi:type IV pilus assembly protein PilE
MRTRCICAAARSRAYGMTLIELLVSMAIVGILAAIAYPSYQAYMVKSNRTDATRALTLDAQALERCYSQNFTYLGCPAVSTLVTASANGYYSVSIPATTLTASSYLITATPAVGSTQNNDAQCTSFSLDSSGTQTSTGTATSQTCWGGN